jgi:uncharacterized protein
MQAMHEGAEVIYQATLRDGQLFGHADFLMRVDGEASDLGTWRYEVADTKLARSPKAKFLVQLAFYSHLLALAQGAEPRQMHVMLGDQTERVPLRRLHALLPLAAGPVHSPRVALADGAQAGTPLPVSHCELCRGASAARHSVADDHLCQVASISRIQWACGPLASTPWLASPRCRRAMIPRLRRHAGTATVPGRAAGRGAAHWRA